jgi:hypothetical protein
MDWVVRFLIGGTIVSVFALIGDVLKPKGFADLFGAAPSVALATLGLTIATQGKVYAAIEARSMVAGAAAFFLYAPLCHWDKAFQASVCDAGALIDLGSECLCALGDLATVNR